MLVIAFLNLEKSRLSDLHNLSKEKFGFTYSIFSTRNFV